MTNLTGVTYASSRAIYFAEEKLLDETKRPLAKAFFPGIIKDLTFWI